MVLILAFMGLGRLVGIAALGVIAIRSVVERRQQIGVLRAIGFKHWMVQLGFMIEFSFIAMMGIAIGVSLAYLMLQAPEMSGGGTAQPAVAAARRDHPRGIWSGRADDVPASATGQLSPRGRGATLRV